MYSVTLELNQICNLRCTYCYLGEKNGEQMKYETAERAIDLAFKNTRIHRDKKLWIDFIGGEPLISFEMIRKLVTYIENKNKCYQYHLIYSTTTNATLISEEIMEYLSEKDFNLKISLDGAKDVNDRNRISLDGVSVHDSIMQRMHLLKLYEEKTHRYVQVTNVITKNNFREYYQSLRYLTDCLEFKIIDSSIDTTVNWSGEELSEFEKILQCSLEYYILRASLQKGFHWGFARMMVGCQSRKERFYTCGGGIISIYVRTDGSIFACPGNLMPEVSIGNVDIGYYKDKFSQLKSVKEIHNDRCRMCDLYDFCKANSCIMQNMRLTGDRNIPVPFQCHMQQLMNRLYIKNKAVLSRVQM